MTQIHYLTHAPKWHTRYVHLHQHEGWYVFFCQRKLKMGEKILHIYVLYERRQAARSAAVRSGTLRSLIRLDGTVGSRQATGEH